MWVFASLCSQKHFCRNARGFINLYLGCVIITTKKKIVVLFILFLQSPGIKAQHIIRAVGVTFGIQQKKRVEILKCYVSVDYQQQYTRRENLKGRTRGIFHFLFCSHLDFHENIRFCTFPLHNDSFFFTSENQMAVPILLTSVLLVTEKHIICSQ